MTFFVVDVEIKLVNLNPFAPPYATLFRLGLSQRGDLQFGHCFGRTVILGCQSWLHLKQCSISTFTTRIERSVTPFTGTGRSCLRSCFILYGF
jgi:hypothetical protein